MAIAYFEMSEWPNGTSNWIGPAAAETEIGGAPASLEVGTSGGAVGEDDDLGVAGEDGRGGVLDHELPGGAADTRAVDPGRAQPHVLRDLDRGEHAHAARAEAVDVGLRQPGVGERPRRRLEVQLERRLDVDASDVGQRRADERDFLGTRHQRSFHSTRLPDANIFCPSAMESGLVPIATNA